MTFKTVSGVDTKVFDARCSKAWADGFRPLGRVEYGTFYYQQWVRDDKGAEEMILWVTSSMYDSIESAKKFFGKDVTMEELLEKRKQQDFPVYGKGKTQKNDSK